MQVRACIFSPFACSFRRRVGTGLRGALQTADAGFQPQITGIIPIIYRTYVTHYSNLGVQRQQGERELVVFLTRRRGALAFLLNVWLLSRS